MKNLDVIAGEQPVSPLKQYRVYRSFPKAAGQQTNATTSIVRSPPTPAEQLNPQSAKHQKTGTPQHIEFDDDANPV